MGRLRRFEEHRYLGTRDDMAAYDCDDDAQFTALEQRAIDDRLAERDMLQTFGPDSLPEARNRGFRPR